MEKLGARGTTGKSSEAEAGVLEPKARIWGSGNRKGRKGWMPRALATKQIHDKDPQCATC
eukprot:3961365-Amphidinium_carterae.1